ncbi:hypothetical protein niasHT_018984 [Heterodera trifolii]|uniref:Uncharacterized protein n=1 Tax=Heterodera trifolii TaxID=157864 RepID=A0ABD2L0P7_9BILA
MNRNVSGDIPLAVYIAAMLSSNRNLGVLLSALQLAKVLLEKLPMLYIPLFETEVTRHQHAHAHPTNAVIWKRCKAKTKSYVPSNAQWKHGKDGSKSAIGIASDHHPLVEPLGKAPFPP